MLRVSEMLTNDFVHRNLLEESALHANIDELERSGGQERQSPPCVFGCGPKSKSDGRSIRSGPRGAPALRFAPER
jgi:hypothetical protein